MKKTIIYLHGYGSSGLSNTVSYLRKQMPDCEVIAPDIPVDPKEALPFLRFLCETRKPDLVIGTSMGAMYAMQMLKCHTARGDCALCENAHQRGANRRTGRSQSLLLVPQ